MSLSLHLIKTYLLNRVPYLKGKDLERKITTEEIGSKELDPDALNINRDDAVNLSSRMLKISCAISLMEEGDS